MEQFVNAVVVSFALSGLEAYERQLDRGLRGLPIRRWIHSSVRNCALEILETHEVGAFLRQRPIPMAMRRGSC